MHQIIVNLLYRAYSIVNLLTYLRAFSNIFLNILTAHSRVYIIIPINVGPRNKRRAAFSIRHVANKFWNSASPLSIISYKFLSKFSICQKWSIKWNYFPQFFATRYDVLTCKALYTKLTTIHWRLIFLRWNKTGWG